MAGRTVLSARLRTALNYIKKGERVADIGTDHAYLPIHLLRERIASRVLAADINRGPLESAKNNLRDAGLLHAADLLETDGLCGVEKWSPDRILIFGMGGELILRILSDAPWIRTPEIGLVLQPMTRASVLRKWLLEEGFCITGETLCTEDGRLYQTIAATWDGVRRTAEDAELLLGSWNIQNRPPLFEAFVRHELEVLQQIKKGKARAACVDTKKEDVLIETLEQLLEGGCK